MPKRKKPESPPTVEQILQIAAQLSRPDLEELLVALRALLEALDNEKDEDTNESQSTKSRSGPRGGSRIEWKLINGYGPYPYLRFRSGGKYRSYYLKDLAVAARSHV